MDKTPHICPGVTYADPNKQILKDWVWEHFHGSFDKDHSIVNGDSYLGFWTKAGTFYYATLLFSGTRK